MDPKTTALVLIEYQNDFTSPGGPLHEAVKPVMESSNMLGVGATAKTLWRARQQRHRRAMVLAAAALAQAATQSEKRGAVRDGGPRADYVR